jgi:hypothetical protein
MDTLKALESTKKWIRALTEISVLLVALSIVAAILFGDGVPFLGGTSEVVERITGLIKTLGDEGVVGMLALGVILYVFTRKDK